MTTNDLNSKYDKTTINNAYIFLQEEEEVWTDFAVDEVEVKDQLVDTLVLELIQDTAHTFNDIFKRKQKHKK